MNTSKGLPMTFTISGTNWIDNSGLYDVHAHTYTTNYLTSDIFFALMFFRIYFIIMAIAMFMPTNQLYSKRVCIERGFEQSFSFQVRSFMLKWPTSTIMVMTAGGILLFAYMIRIFERPYYWYTFNEADGPNSDLRFYDFDSISSSIWFTIITMSSVGYVNIIASTPVGRAITLCAVIYGAFILSLTVGVTTALFNLEDS